MTHFKWVAELRSRRLNQTIPGDATFPTISPTSPNSVFGRRFEICNLDESTQLPYPEESFDLIHARSIHIGVSPIFLPFDFVAFSLSGPCTLCSSFGEISGVPNVRMWLACSTEMPGSGLVSWSLCRAADRRADPCASQGGLRNRSLHARTCLLSRAPGSVTPIAAPLQFQGFGRHSMSLTASSCLPISFSSVPNSRWNT